MTEAIIFDAIRTPRGKGRYGGALCEVGPVQLLAGLIDTRIAAQPLLRAWTR